MVYSLNCILGNLEILEKGDAAPIRRSARTRKTTEIATMSHQQQGKSNIKGQRDQNYQLALPPPTISNKREKDFNKLTDTEEENGDETQDCPTCN